MFVFSDAYPLQQVDYFWKARDKQGIVILADEMNEYTLTDIKTRKGLVHYGTRSSSKLEFNFCAIALFTVNFSYCITEIQCGCVDAMTFCSETTKPPKLIHAYVILTVESAIQ